MMNHPEEHSYLCRDHVAWLQITKASGNKQEESSDEKKTAKLFHLPTIETNTLVKSHGKGKSIFFPVNTIKMIIFLDLGRACLTMFSMSRFSISYPRTKNSVNVVINHGPALLGTPKKPELNST